MQLEEEGVGLLASQNPEHARTIDQRLELLAIYRATEQLRTEGLQNSIRAQEKFQRQYLLQHLHITTTIQRNIQQKNKRTTMDNTTCGAWFLQ